MGPIPEHIKVPIFLNGLRHGPSRQALFKKVPSIIEEAIGIALVKDQSYNTAYETPWQKPASERSAATPMEFGNADVVCYNCGKRSHMMARCNAKAGASATASNKKPPNTKGGAKNHRARRSDSASTKHGSGNAVAR